MNGGSYGGFLEGCFVLDLCVPEEGDSQLFWQVIAVYVMPRVEKITSRQVTTLLVTASSRGCAAAARAAANCMAMLYRNGRRIAGR